MAVTVGIGTTKGAFFLHSKDRRTWTVDEPQFVGWKVTAFGKTPSGEYLLCTGSNWYGAAIHRSTELTEWTQIVEGPSYGESEDRKLTQIWTLTTAGSTIWAGVDTAGLFRSDDDGATWKPIPGLNDHATREGWEPGLGGLAAHRVLVDPTNADRLWCAISAVGVFRSENGGETWAPKNQGVTAASESADYPGIGHCVHCIVGDPENPDTLWRQDHKGVYMTTNAGDTWEQIEEGLPANFGFPVVRDNATGALFIVPLQSDEVRLPPSGQLRVFRSTDRGTSWHNSGDGLPETSYAVSLRGAMDADQLEPGGVIFGTTGGSVHASADVGETWTTLPFTFPRILAVKVLESS